MIDDRCFDEELERFIGANPVVIVVYITKKHEFV